MSEFTYKKPDEKQYYDAVMKALQASLDFQHKLIAFFLSNSKCSISVHFGQYGNRANSYCTTIHIKVQPQNITEFDERKKSLLKQICDAVMPKETGLDVTCVEISALLEEPNIVNIDDVQTKLDNLLPDDIKAKGKEMAETYLYLYYVENSLRIFIEKTLVEKFGNDYFSQIQIPSKIRTNIENRKGTESKNKWLSVRGSSDIFYLDFKDLADIITNNWTCFQSLFPNQQWLTVKVDELGNIRNLVAHNSYITEEDKTVLQHNFNQIIKQIKP
ncbi:MAG: hypothetical protein LBH22_09300 [Bacteroidales bacterium]|nr:hypothetical protein [Bacteroidales bacterium]